MILSLQQTCWSKPRLILTTKGLPRWNQSLRRLLSITAMAATAHPPERIRGSNISNPAPSGCPREKLIYLADAETLYLYDQSWCGNSQPGGWTWGWETYRQSKRSEGPPMRREKDVQIGRIEYEEDGFSMIDDKGSAQMQAIQICVREVMCFRHHYINIRSWGFWNPTKLSSLLADVGFGRTKNYFVGSNMRKMDLACL